MTDEQAAAWAASVRRMQKCQKRARVMTRISGYLSLFYALMTLFGLLETKQRLWLGIVDMLVCWFFYFGYLNRRREVALWQQAIHDGQRMLVETRERAVHHSQRLSGVLEKLQKLL